MKFDCCAPNSTDPSLRILTMLKSAAHRAGKTFPPSTKKVVNFARRLLIESTFAILSDEFAIFSTQDLGMRKSDNRNAINCPGHCTNNFPSSVDFDSMDFPISMNYLLSTLLFSKKTDFRCHRFVVS